jgi:hypothetical protein
LLMLVCKITGTSTKHMWLIECQYSVIILSYKFPWTWSICWSWNIYKYEVTGQIHPLPNNGVMCSQICVSTFFFRYACRLNVM